MVKAQTVCVPLTGLMPVLCDMRWLSEQGTTRHQSITFISLWHSKHVILFCMNSK